MTDTAESPGAVSFWAGCVWPPAANREQLASGTSGGKIAAFCKKAAQASALYWAAVGGSHSHPTDLNKPVFSIFDAMCHETPGHISGYNAYKFGTIGNVGNGLSCGYEWGKTGVN